MENLFRPVHKPSPSDRIKQQRNQHHHEFYHHQETHSPRYTTDDDDRNTDDSRKHHRHHQHNHYRYGNPRRDVHCPHLFLHSEESDQLYNHRTSVTLSRASSSSISSSSSASSSFTEASSNEPFSLHHAERPQHSLSCSNISEVRKALMEDESSEPVVFATIKHSKKDNVVGKLRNDPHPDFSYLNRGHSRSEEGLLPTIKGDVGRERSKESQMNYGALYKTTSLNRSLAFSEEDILLGVSSGPKRAVSSSMLPSKGILKNKINHTDIRKAKSMEVLSPRVTKGEGQSGQKSKGITQAEIEQAKANFVKGKLQFSAFLDEITRQVMSPSHLSILGVNSNKTTGKTPASVPTSNSVKPQLPPKKHRVGKRTETAQPLKQPNRQDCSSSGKDSDCSNPDKLFSYTTRNHRGSPPPHNYASSSTHGLKNRRPSPTGESTSGDRYGRYGPHHIDGTSTSSEPTHPEPARPKQRYQHKYQQSTFHNRHTQQFPQKVHQDSGRRGPSVSPPPSAQETGAGFGSESSSTKSDLSRGRETASTTTSHSSELSGRQQSHNTGISKQYMMVLRESKPVEFQGCQCTCVAGTVLCSHVAALLFQTAHYSQLKLPAVPPVLSCTDTEQKWHKPRTMDLLCDPDDFQALQEENADLHQNLLQTVVCIESLEAELQRTRDELSHVKDKYKSLLQTHTGTMQADNLLGEHLHIASESLSSERKFLLNRVSQLGSELEEAHRTITALENINVPRLLKELLEKHFGSAEAVQKFLATSFPINRHPDPEPEEAAHDWLSKPEAGSQRVTAFVPVKAGLPQKKHKAALAGQHEPSHIPSPSVPDSDAPDFKTSFPAKPLPVYPPNQQQASHSGPQQQAHTGRWEGRGGLKVLLLEEEAGDVSSMSAQLILDGFIQHLQTRQESDGGKEQQSVHG